MRLVMYGVMAARSSGSMSTPQGKIEACTVGMDTLPSDTVFLDGELSPKELADNAGPRRRAHR